MAGVALDFRTQRLLSSVTLVLKLNDVIEKTMKFIIIYFLPNGLLILREESNRISDLSVVGLLLDEILI